MPKLPTLTQPTSHTRDFSLPDRRLSKGSESQAKQALIQEQEQIKGQHALGDITSIQGWHNNRETLHFQMGKLKNPASKSLTRKKMGSMNLDGYKLKPHQGDHASQSLLYLKNLLANLRSERETSNMLSKEQVYGGKNATSQLTKTDRNTLIKPADKKQELFVSPDQTEYNRKVIDKLIHGVNGINRASKPKLNRTRKRFTLSELMV